MNGWEDLPGRMQEYDTEEAMAEGIPDGAELLARFEFYDVGDELAVKMTVEGVDPAALGRILIDVGQKMIRGEQQRRSVAN